MTRPGRNGIRSRRAGGFSLLELLIVIGIILLLAGISGLVLFNRRDQADRDTAKIQLTRIRDAMRFFYQDFRRYPTDDEGLEVLWTKSKLDSESDAGNWREYLEPLNKDPWGNAYQYLAESEDYDPEAEDGPSVPYEIWSNGPDGEQDTDDDIRLDTGGASSDEDSLDSDLIGNDGP